MPNMTSFSLSYEGPYNTSSLTISACRDAPSCTVNRDPEEVIFKSLVHSLQFLQNERAATIMILPVLQFETRGMWVVLLCWRC